MSQKRLPSVSIPTVFAIVGLFTLALPRPSSAAWPLFGQAVTKGPKAQQHPAIASDGVGGAIIVWQDLRRARGNVFAQHVLASGAIDAAWPVDGLSVLRDTLALAGTPEGQASPLIVSDGAGGAIVAWHDARNLISERDVFAQHLLGSGAVDPFWPVNGVVVCSAPGIQDVQRIVSDDAGGAIVAWSDRRAGPTTSAVFVQRALASGVVHPLWPVNGIGVSATPAPQVFPALIGDGTGGAIVAWGDGRGGTTSGFDIFAQHVSSAGALDPLWPVTGRALCAATGDQAHPVLVSDGAHGGVAAWSDSRVVGTSHIFAQHVFARGTVDAAWPANGRAVSAAGFLESRPLVVTDGAGGAIVNWQAFDVHLNQYAQHVLGNGRWLPGRTATTSSPITSSIRARSIPRTRQRAGACATCRARRPVPRSCRPATRARS
ncbi:MAG: hypothetical protein ACREOU_12900 [Candidatus Eiseniibacteriota bacterium]